MNVLWNQDYSVQGNMKCVQTKLSFSLSNETKNYNKQT